MSVIRTVYRTVLRRTAPLRESPAATQLALTRFIEHVPAHVSLPPRTEALSDRSVKDLIKACFSLPPPPARDECPTGVVPEAAIKAQSEKPKVTVKDNAVDPQAISKAFAALRAVDEERLELLLLAQWESHLGRYPAPPKRLKDAVTSLAGVSEAYGSGGFAAAADNELVSAAILRETWAPELLEVAGGTNTAFSLSSTAGGEADAAARISERCGDSVAAVRAAVERIARSAAAAVVVPDAADPSGDAEGQKVRALVRAVTQEVFGNAGVAIAAQAPNADVAVADYDAVAMLELRQGHVLLVAALYAAVLRRVGVECGLAKDTDGDVYVVAAPESALRGPGALGPVLIDIRQAGAMVDLATAPAKRMVGLPPRVFASALVTRLLWHLGAAKSARGLDGRPLGEQRQRGVVKMLKAQMIHVMCP